MEKLDPEFIRRHKGTSFTGISTVFTCHDGKGKFLMSKRSKNARDEHGKWEVPGGGLKWGSTVEENIRREVREELCAEVKEAKFIGYRDVFRQKPDGTKTHWLVMDFMVLVDPDEVKIGEPELCDGIGWFTLSEQPTPVHSQHKEFLIKYQKELSEITK